MTPRSAVGFDFDHTLGTDGGLERDAFYRYAQERGRPFAADDAGARAAIDDALARMRAGTLAIDDGVAGVFAEADLAAAGARWRQICCALVPGRVKPLDGAREVLAALRARGVPVAILTNGWSPLQQRKVDEAFGDDAPSTILVSDALGAQKPARAAFDALVAAFAVPRERVWYVGDNALGDAAGARDAGLRSVWLNEDGQSYPQDRPQPDLCIGSLRELETLIGNASFP